MTQEQAEQLKAEIRQILAGIDDTELSVDDGWWETSTGAEFGEAKLVEVLAVIDRATESQ